MKSYPRDEVRKRGTVSLIDGSVAPWWVQIRVKLFSEFTSGVNCATLGAATNDELA